MLNIELQDFCSTDDCRESIMTPFVRDGWKYATDGRIMVRIKTDEPDDSGQPHKRPNAAKLFEGFDVSKLEAFNLPELKGVENQTCRYCSGNGVQTCSLGHDHDCDECDTTGLTEKWPEQDIGKARFSERFLVKIKNLPGLRFYPTTAETPALFTFDNGEGILLACVRKECR